MYTFPQLSYGSQLPNWLSFWQQGESTFRRICKIHHRIWWQMTDKAEFVALAYIKPFKINDHKNKLNYSWQHKGQKAVTTNQHNMTIRYSKILHWYHSNWVMRNTHVMMRWQGKFLANKVIMWDKVITLRPSWLNRHDQKQQRLQKCWSCFQSHRH